ncbi:MAG: FAD-dependent oxidoreductase, partial [Chloroflexota bacterium]|nr:FAD-dependent oxidoreductase [Chloroflexota bacterium]
MSADGSTAVDVVVIGGGVAGSAAAIALADAGLQVLLIEREPRFRDRVRG